MNKEERIKELERELASLRETKTPIRDMFRSVKHAWDNFWWDFDAMWLLPIALAIMFVVAMAGGRAAHNEDEKRGASRVKCNSVQELVDPTAKWYPTVKACISKPEDGTLIYYTLKDGKFDKRIVKP